MRLLMITTGFLPYQFSENLCNAKLVYALQEDGVEVDVISRKDVGPSYGAEWKEPWLTLKDNTYEIQYPLGNKFKRVCDVAYSGWKMDRHFEEGIRWARRAYELAVKLMQEHHYDAVLTRSPSDIPHLVGYKLKKHNLQIRWIANWNDPATPIWPEPYKHSFTAKKQNQLESNTEKLLLFADVNTFPSDSLRLHFLKHFPRLDMSRTAVIPHIGLSKKIFTRHTVSPTNKLRFCHAGNLSIERNPELFFKVLRTIVDEGKDCFSIDIMGHANELTELLIEKYKLHEQVRLIGSYPYLEAVDKLQDYDVLVLLEAQLQKGIFFASKFTDYAQTGKPILCVSPKNGFASDVISRYGGGIAVDNTSESCIEDGIEKLIELWRGGLLSTMSSEYLYKCFSPEYIVNQLKTIVS